MISWQQLLDLGSNASDGNLRARLANIAINQVMMMMMMMRRMMRMMMMMTMSHHNHLHKADKLEDVDMDQTCTGDANIKLLFYTNQQPKRQIIENLYSITNFEKYFFMIIMMIIPTPILNSDDQCCALSYTSGTTGNPKGSLAFFSFYIDDPVIVISISIIAIIILIMIIRDDAFTRLNDICCSSKHGSL